MAPKFEWWQSSNDHRFYFHMKSSNGKIIAAGQGYLTKEGCLDGIKAIKAEVSSAPPVPATPSRPTSHETMLQKATTLLQQAGAVQ